MKSQSRVYGLCGGIYFYNVKEKMWARAALGSELKVAISHREESLLGRPMVGNGINLI